MDADGGKVAGTEGNLRGISRMRPHNLLGVPGYIYHMLREARARGQRIEGLKTIVLGADAVPGHSVQAVVVGENRTFRGPEEYLRERGVEVLGDPTVSRGASEGQRWVYFLSPWGMQFELVSYPGGKAFDHDPERFGGGRL